MDLSSIGPPGKLCYAFVTEFEMAGRLMGWSVYNWVFNYDLLHGFAGNFTHPGAPVATEYHSHSKASFVHFLGGISLRKRYIHPRGESIIDNFHTNGYPLSAVVPIGLNHMY
jgi:hypothetical protein